MVFYIDLNKPFYYNKKERNISFRQIVCIELNTIHTTFSNGVSSTPCFNR